MTFKKDDIIKILEGAESTFDIFGTNFRSTHHRRNNVYNSWHNTGVYFSRAFEGYKSSQIDSPKEKAKISF